MARKYIYVRVTEDYAGHKKDEVLKLRDKIPPHMEDYVEKTTENVYTKYAKEQAAEQRRLQQEKEQADRQAQEQQSADPNITREYDADQNQEGEQPERKSKKKP